MHNWRSNYLNFNPLYILSISIIKYYFVHICPFLTDQLSLSIIINNRIKKKKKKKEITTTSIEKGPSLCTTHYLLLNHTNLMFNSSNFHGVSILSLALIWFHFSIKAKTCVHVKIPLCFATEVRWFCVRIRCCCFSPVKVFVEMWNSDVFSIRLCPNSLFHRP